MRGLRKLDADASLYLRTRTMPAYLRWAAELFTHTGDYWLWALGLVIVWAIGNQQWKEWAMIYFVGIVLVVAVVAPIKFMVRRQRPEAASGSLYHKADPHSFPSGHAARVTLIATLSWQLAPLWMAVLLVAWAVVVALLRVALGVHYLSDVLVGGLLGLVIGYALGPFL